MQVVSFWGGLVARASRIWQQIEQPGLEALLAVAVSG
jgi:hypothetical protein